MTDKETEMQDIDFEAEPELYNQFKNKGVLDKDGRHFTEPFNNSIQKRVRKYTSQYTSSGYLNLKYQLEAIKDISPELKEFAKNKGVSDTIFNSDLLEGSEVFEIDNKTIWILQNTNNEIFERELPFGRIIIDCNINIDGKWFKGIFLSKDIMLSFWGTDDINCEEPIGLTPFSKTETEDMKAMNDMGKLQLDESTKEKLKMFVCNFIDFINNPEVRIVKFERSEKNRLRRIKDGKPELPSENKIRITGSLLEYYNTIQPEHTNHLNYRQLIRGHYVRFWDRERYSRLYNLLEAGKLPERFMVDKSIKEQHPVIAFFKKPFLRGTGMLIQKNYILEKK